MVVDTSNNFLLTLQDILNPDLSLMFGKMQVIKQYSRFSRFLLLRQYYISGHLKQYSCGIKVPKNNLTTLNTDVFLALDANIYSF